MSRTRIVRSRHRAVVAAAAVTLVAAGCGGSSSSEEELIDNVLDQLEDQEGLEDIDFDSDGDGGFSIDSEDFSVSVDEEGNVQFEGPDGSGSFEIDADGSGGGEISFEGEDGSGSIEVDEDGSFTVVDEDGEVTTGESSGEDGSFTITGEDGEATFESGSDIPDDWPSDIPQPEGFTEVASTVFTEGGSTNIVLTGQVDADPEDYVAAYAAELTGAGFTEESSFTQAGSMVSASYVRDDTTVSIVITSDGTETVAVVSVNVLG